MINTTQKSTNERREQYSPEPAWGGNIWSRVMIPARCLSCHRINNVTPSTEEPEDNTLDHECQSINNGM